MSDLNLLNPMGRGVRIRRNGGRIKNILIRSVAVNLPPVDAPVGDEQVIVATTTATVTGAALGDAVMVGTTTGLGDKHTLQAQVSAANTVRLTAANYDEGGASWDHPSETFHFWVFKKH